MQLAMRHCRARLPHESHFWVPGQTVHFTKCGNHTFVRAPLSLWPPKSPSFEDPIQGHRRVWMPAFEWLRKLREESLLSLTDVRFVNSGCTTNPHTSDRNSRQSFGEADSTEGQDERMLHCLRGSSVNPRLLSVIRNNIQRQKVRKRTTVPQLSTLRSSHFDRDGTADTFCQSPFRARTC
jgi:hypothetical protein